VLGRKSIATVIDPDGPLSQVTAACPELICDLGGDHPALRVGAEDPVEASTCSLAYDTTLAVGV
jgi:hypothetical protein